jgi:hypothetical protein
MRLRCFYREYTAIFLLLVVHPIGLKRFLAAALTVSLPTGSKGNNTRLRLFLGPQALTFTASLPVRPRPSAGGYRVAASEGAYAASYEWVRRLAFADADGHPLRLGMGPDNKRRGPFLHYAARYPRCRLPRVGSPAPAMAPKGRDGAIGSAAAAIRGTRIRWRSTCGPTPPSSTRTNAARPPSTCPRVRAPDAILRFTLAATLLLVADKLAL